MEITNEIWKDIDGYDGSYKVSTFGRVGSLKYGDFRIMKPANNKDGTTYNNVKLSLNGNAKTFRIHQLMAIAFLNHNVKNRKFVVDHIDNNKTNNILSNLQLITPRANVIKDTNRGASKYVGVKRNSTDRWRAYATINGVRLELGTYDTEKQAYNAYLKAIN